MWFLKGARGHFMRWKLIKILFFAVVITVLVVIFWQQILIQIGRYLAPSTEEKAEVLIVEGTQVVKIGAINASLQLLSAGRVKRMIILLHLTPRDGQLFGIQKSYPEILTKELEYMGIDKQKAEIVLVPIDKPPITFKEARFIVSKLSGDGVKSAILLSKGFHTRRSFGVYEKEGSRVGLHIVAFSYFTEYERDKWWIYAAGVRDFIVEYFKLLYYILNGYISMSGLYVNIGEGGNTLP